MFIAWKYPALATRQSVGTAVSGASADGPLVWIGVVV
jgi:hypothetical protein